MKILLTGSNNRQCGTAKITSKRIFDAWNLCQMLRTFANVDFIPIQKDTNFSQYDISVVGLGTLGSFTYSDVLKALYVIGKANNVVIFLEDWKCPKHIATALTKLYNDGFENFVNKTFNKVLSSGDYFYTGISDGIIDAETVWLGIEKVVTQSITNKYLIPAFNWGDKSIVANILNTKTENILYFDQTPFLIEQYDIKDCEYNSNRHKKFLYCGLSNQDSWLKKRGIKDITDCFGHSPYEKLPSESDVNDKHHEYLGIAIPEYYHSGSGWFRIRYIYSAMAKNICMISDNDAKALGIKSINSFDNISDEEIKNVAMAIYEAVKQYIPTKDEACNALQLKFEALV